MSTITATIDIGSDSVNVISGLLSRFPNGHRVHLVLADEQEVAPRSKSDLVDWLKACPEKGWFSALDQKETINDFKEISFE